MFLTRSLRVLRDHFLLTREKCQRQINVYGWELPRYIRQTPQPGVLVSIEEMVAVAVGGKKVYGSSTQDRSPLFSRRPAKWIGGGMTSEVSENMMHIFSGLQGLLEEAIPDLHKEDPRKLKRILALVSSGQASFGARVRTSPDMVTLTIIHKDGEHDLVSYFYSGALN